MAGEWHGGKGSKPRPIGVERSTFDDNWDRIFGQRKHNGRPSNPAPLRGLVKLRS